MSEPQASSPPNRPWWREYMMWLVVGGPSVVVVASFVTLALAIAYPDPVIEVMPAQAGASSDAAMNSAQTPAMKARNHAATGGR